MLAFKKARKKGFKRQLNWERYIKEMMKNQYSFTTTPQDKKIVVNIITRDLMELENICVLLEQGKLYSYSVIKRMVDCAMW